MIWAIDNDDFVPECSNVRYPLLRAINAEFKAASIDILDRDTTSSKPTEDPEVQKGESPRICSVSFPTLNLLTFVIVAFSFTY